MLPYGIPVPLFLGQGEMSNSFYESASSGIPDAVEEWLSGIFEVDLTAIGSGAEGP